MASFLQELFGNKPDGTFVLIWTLEDKRSAWFNDVAQAERYALALKERDVYVGVGLASQDYGPNVRCTITDRPVVALVGMWADVDIKGPAHKKTNLPANVTQAWELIALTGVEPSIVLNSGHGLQAWFLFKEPWVLDTPEERQKARDFAQDWQDTLKVISAGKGFEFDSTSDLERVMRVVGTTNNKLKDNPAQVSLLRFTERRYNPSDLEEKFLALPKPLNKLDPKAIQVGNFTMDPMVSLPAKFKVLAEAEPRFKLTWQNKRPDMKDTSPSAYEMALANYAAQAAWTDQEIVDLLIAFRREIRATPKLRAERFKQTIANARASAGQLIAVNGDYQEVSGAIADAKEGQEKEGQEKEGQKKEGQKKEGQEESQKEEGQKEEGQKEEGQKEEGQKEEGQKKEESQNLPGSSQGEALQALSKALGFGVLRFVREKAEPESNFRLYTDRGNVLFGPAKNVRSLLKFQEMVWAELGVEVPDFKKPVWKSYLAFLMAIREDVDLGPDVTEAGMGGTRLTDYLKRTPIYDNAAEALDLNKPYRKNGAIYFRAADFGSWLARAHRETLSQPKIGGMLRAAGCELAREKLGGGTTKVNTTKSIWSAPREFWPKSQLKKDGGESALESQGNAL